MKNNPFKTSEEFLYGQNGGTGRVIDVEAARQEAELDDSGSGFSTFMVTLFIILICIDLNIQGFRQLQKN